MRTLQSYMDNEGGITMFDVVVCTKNSALTLGACLYALFNSDIPIGKVFIVDKNSSDGTKKIAEKYRCIYKNNDMTLAEARRYGAQLCKTKYFISLDSDIIVPRDFYSILKPYIKENFVTKGIYINVLPKKHMKIALRDHNWMFSHIGSLDCCIIHRKLFLRISKRWIEMKLDAGEDTDLFWVCKEYNLPIHQDVNVVSKHYVFSVMRLLKQTVWYAKSSRRGRLRGRYFILHPCFLPLEILGFPLMGLVESITWRSWKLFIYQTAKMFYWFKGYIFG